jgi:quinol monooxygenase YgiN
MGTEIMVVVRGRLRSGTSARLLDAVGPLVAATRAEPGCLEYAIYVSASEFEEIASIERWRSAADAEAHMSRPHTRAFLAIAAECLVAPPVFRTMPLA